MPHVITTDNAGEGIRRCVQFLLNKNIPAAIKAARLIDMRLKVLANMPDYGSPYPPDPTKRQLIIPFGDSGYIALYHHIEIDDVVYVLAFRHQKEVDY